MRIVWTPQAEQDRFEIWAYIEQRNPDAAARMDQHFSDSVVSLTDFPMRGHEGDVVGTRELNPHRNYRLIYEVDGETVWILAIVHAARRWPPVRS